MGNGGMIPASQAVQPAVKVKKMNLADDPEAYLNAFECTVTAQDGQKGSG